MTQNEHKVVQLPDELTFILGGVQGGGAERVAIQLMEEWIKKGVSINLITMRGPEMDVYPIPKKVNRIILGGEGESANKFTAFLKNLWYVYKVKRAIKQIKSKTVISFLTRANIYAILACFGLNKHLVISERNDTTKQPLEWPWKSLRKKLYKFADVVTANSNVALSSMEEYVPGKKLKLVLNPLKVPEIGNTANPSQSKIILNAARLTAHKAQSLIIDAMSLLNERFSDWSLIILGEGEERKNLEMQADKLNVRSKLTMPGFVKNISDYYTKAAIFIIPSQYEGTPNALLEAMGYGLPCIVSDSLPGALELIEEGKSGLIFKSGNAEDLSSKIRLLIENPELRVEIGQSARDVVSGFSIEKAIITWEEILSN